MAVPLLLSALLLNASTACHRAVERAQGAETLLRAGFADLGRSFYYKPGEFLVRLDNRGFVLNVITSRDALNGRDHGTTTEHPYKAVALIANESSSAGKSLLLIGENGACTEMEPDGSLEGTCANAEQAGAFSPNEMGTGTPLKARLRKIARQLTPTVYTIADPGESQQDFYAVYRGERLAFAGHSQPGALSRNTRVLGFRVQKRQFEEEPVGTLELSGAYIRYSLGSDGEMITGSARQLRELPSNLTRSERYSETDGSGFHIGGVNGADAIDKMNTLTNKTIEEIERDARPGGLSQDGFLGEGEKFKERLKADDAFVRGRGFTHQALAGPLFAVMNILDAIGDQRFDDFTYRGRHYRAEYRIYRGFQESLFNDGLQASRDYTVTNIGTGRKLGFSPLVPFYIARYGFYEGRTPYRVEPADILEVFQLKPGQ